MNPENALAAVNDLASSLVGVVEVQALRRDFLARLLVHTGMSVACLLSRSRERAGRDDHALVEVAGNAELVRHLGGLAPALGELARGPSGALGPLRLEVVPSERIGVLRYGLRLSVEDDSTIIMLGSQPGDEQLLHAMEAGTLMQRFARALALCRDYEAQASLLAKQIELRRSSVAHAQRADALCRALMRRVPGAAGVIDLSSHALLQANDRLRDLLGMESNQPLSSGDWLMKLTPASDGRWALAAELEARIAGARAAAVTPNLIEPIAFVATEGAGDAHVLELHLELIGDAGLLTVVGLCDQTGVDEADARLVRTGVRLDTPSESIAPLLPRRPRILVVEDHPINQRLLALQLGEVGDFEVVLTSHGAQALIVWQRHDVDLILTDCAMPHVDGYELTALLRESESRTGGHLPIIAVSASATSDDVERCVLAGMDLCLAKPLSLESLRAGIATVLDTQRSHGSPRGQVARAARRAVYESTMEGFLGRHRDEAKTFLASFFDSLTAGMTAARSALRDGDGPGVAQQMHSLKTSAGLIGATVLATEARVMEAAARAADNTAMAELWPLLESAWELVSEDISMPDEVQ